MNRPSPGPFGSFKCGCTIGNHHGYIDILRCGLHDAAPELLSALKEQLAWCEGKSVNEAELVARTRAIIAKAEGKS